MTILDRAYALKSLSLLSSSSKAKILAAIELRREDVYIVNVLKHRPPGNRNPEPDEVGFRWG